MRAAYYAGLKLTQNAREFSNSVREQLEYELRELNDALPFNDQVRLRLSGENRIQVTPFAPAPEPRGLVSLKAEIGRRWSMTGLLDALKEAAAAYEIGCHSSPGDIRVAVAKAMRQRLRHALASSPQSGAEALALGMDKLLRPSGGD